MKRSAAPLAILILAALPHLAAPAAADELRPLKVEAVDRVIEEHDRAVQACARGARGHDTLAVLLHLEIDGDGQVLSAAPPSGKPSSQAACLARVARKLRFPATGVVSHVDYPFMLTPLVRR